jgi:hypothetical protein
LFAALPVVGRAQATPAEEKKPSGPTITPYGFILLNTFFSARPFAADDYPQYALAAPTATNDRGILFSSRYNRFGVRVGGLEAMGAKVGAALEVDFGFGFALAGNQNVNQSIQTVNFDFYRPLVRMRIGYATATWDLPEARLTLLLGQDYALVNPLFAVTLGYIGTPLFQNAGNIYTRAPQVKLTADIGKTTGLTLQAAVMDPMDQNADVRTGQNQETPTLSSGNRSRIPQIEGRVAGRAKTDIVQTEVGVSGSYHKERYALGTFAPGNPTAAAPSAAAFTANGRFVDVDSMIGGVDAIFKFPFIEVRGEGYIGHNVDMYYGHLGQGGVNPVTAAGTVANTTVLNNVIAKRTKGFWVQGIVGLVPEIQLTGGYGVDTPFRADVPNVNGNRVRNSIASAGIIVSASKNLKFGAEGAYTYTTTRTGTATDLKVNGYQTVLSSQLTF